MVSILVHDGDDGTMLGLGDATSRAYLLVGNLMSIETSDVDIVPSEANDMGVITPNFIIGTTINKHIVAIVLVLLVVGNMVHSLFSTNRWHARRGAFAHGYLPLYGVGFTLQQCLVLKNITLVTNDDLLLRVMLGSRLSQLDRNRLLAKGGRQHLVDGSNRTLGWNDRLLGFRHCLHDSETGDDGSAHCCATPQFVLILQRRHRIIALGIKELVIVCRSVHSIMKVDHEIMSRNVRQVDLQLGLKISLSRHVMQDSLLCISHTPRLGGGKNDKIVSYLTGADWW